jgi:hypothetical protein
MKFEYDIDQAEYVAAQLLLIKRAGTLKHSFTYLLIGIGLLCIPALTPDIACSFNWAAFAFAIWFFYIAICQILTPFLLRRRYPKSGVVGKRYSATVDDGGLNVSGDDRAWQFKWSAIEAKGEDQRVFMFYAPTVVFTFGKRFLAPEQQSELRRFAELQDPLP